MKKIIFIAVSSIIAFVLSLYFYASHNAQKLPDRCPENICGDAFGKGSKKVVVCLGDSITHGRVSYNYIDILAERFGDEKFVFVNGGINSELAYNLLQRIDTIKACKPDIITILIGTNDVNAILAKDNTERYIKDMNLPQTPDINWYRKNLLEICKRLKETAEAKIALLSLPPVGENLHARENKKTEEYSRVVEEVAKLERVAYLPLHEMMVNYLQKNRSEPVFDFNSRRKVMYVGVFKRYILMKSYEQISEENGHLLLTDFLHLNSKGAGMVADLIEKFIRGN